MSYEINWEEIRIGYNRMYKTRFKTVKDFLSKLYEKTNSLTEIERILGITIPTISKKLKSLEIAVNGKGGPNHLPDKKNLFLNIDPEKMKKMTKIEIMIECNNMSLGYLDQLLRKYKRECIKLKNGESHYAYRKYRSRIIDS